MHLLNTTRYLRTPATDATIERLLDKLTGGMASSLGAGGVRCNLWLMSEDRRTFQAFSGFGSADEVLRAEASPDHLRNSEGINELLGGLAVPQQHTRYRLMLSRAFQ